jgi:ElaB/YqjD/DUF883 family membrane-anchored ribosome-binding protein
MQEDGTMWGQKHTGENRSMLGSDSRNGAFLNTQQATEAIENLRSGIDQASRIARDARFDAGRRTLGGGPAGACPRYGERLAQPRRVVSTVSQQVEHNPLISLGVAFAVGFICASLIRR